jgi:hypothetical protein
VSVVPLSFICFLKSPLNVVAGAGSAWPVRLILKSFVGLNSWMMMRLGVLVSLGLLMINVAPALSLVTV